MNTSLPFQLGSRVRRLREDDVTMDFSRPLTFQKIKAGLDDSGKLVAFNHDVVSAWPTKRWGIPAFLSPDVETKGALDAFTVNGADFFYTVPNHNVRAIINEHHASIDVRSEPGHGAEFVVSFPEVARA